MPRKTKQQKRKINYLGVITSEDNEETDPEEIHQMTQINKIIPDNNDHYGVNGEKQRFIIDTGSPVTIMRNNTTLYKPEYIEPLRENNQDVNKSEIKLLAKVRVNIKYNNT